MSPICTASNPIVISPIAQSSKNRISFRRKIDEETVGIFKFALVCRRTSGETIQPFENISRMSFRLSTV